MTTNDANQTSPANQISLLAYLAYKFGGQTETIATEALGYILSRSEAARNALRETIRIGGVDVGRIARVQTEVIGEKMERVDLSAYDDAGEERVLIEAKFWAGLTGNQPDTYLKRLLQNKNPSALLFVAPESRLVTLWAELGRLANDGGFGLGAGTVATGLQGAVVNNGPHRLVLTSWRAMLGAMASRASVEGDSSAERGIIELNGLCEQEDSDAFLPLRTDELGPQFARRMPHFIKLTEDARKDKRVRPFVTRTYPIHSATNSHGRYLTLVDDVPVWFGVRYDLWAKRGDTPLWLVIRRTPFDWAADFNEVKSCLEPLIIRDPNILDDPEGLLIPFFLPTGVEREEALESVAAYLAKVADLLSRSPQPASEQGP